MAENNELGIKITATNQAAATLDQLKETLKQLEVAAANFGKAAQTGLQSEIASVKAAISAHGGQVESIKNVTKAMAEQRAMANYINRDMDLANSQMRRQADLENQLFNQRQKAAAAAQVASACGMESSDSKIIAMKLALMKQELSIR